MSNRVSILVTAIAILAALSMSLQLSRSAVAQSTIYTPIDIGAIANHTLDWLTSPPYGNQTLGGVPFRIRSGGNAIFMTAQRFLESNPTEGSVSVPGIAGVRSVRVLLTGGYVLQQFRNQKVGEISLGFADGSSLTTPLIGWQNIRENWCYERDIAGACTMSPPSGSFTFQNVWSESQSRGDRARAFLDMLTIPVSGISAGLTSITIRDTSAFTAGSADPALQVTAITVESSPAPVATPLPARPSPPQFFRTHIVGDTNLQLRWEAQPGATVLIYSPCTCACYVNTPPGSSFFTVTGLTPGGGYCFIAIAGNDGGWSDWTPWLCLNTNVF